MTLVCTNNATSLLGVRLSRVSSELCSQQLGVCITYISWVDDNRCLMATLNVACKMNLAGNVPPKRRKERFLWLTSYMTDFMTCTLVSCFAKV